MSHLSSLPFETQVKMFMCVTFKVIDISAIVVWINFKFPRGNDCLLLKSVSVPFWKLIVWCKGHDVRGRVWAGLTEALTFNLSQQTPTWPTQLKGALF